MSKFVYILNVQIPNHINILKILNLSKKSVGIYKRHLFTSSGSNRKIICLEFPLTPFPVNFVSTNLKNSNFSKALPNVA